MGVLFYKPEYTPRWQVHKLSDSDKACNPTLSGVAPHHQLVSNMSGDTGRVLYEYSLSDYNIGCGPRLQAPDNEQDLNNFKRVIVERMSSKLGLEHGVDRVVVHKTGGARVDIFLSTAARAHDVNDQLDDSIDRVQHNGVECEFYQRTEVDAVTWPVGTELVYFGPHAHGCDIPVTVTAQLCPTEYEVRFRTDNSTHTVHSRHLAEPTDAPTGCPAEMVCSHEITVRLSVANPETAYAAGVSQMDRMAMEAEQTMEEAISKGDLEGACNAGARMAWWRTHALRLRHELRTNS